MRASIVLAFVAIVRVRSNRDVKTADQVSSMSFIHHKQYSCTYAESHLEGGEVVVVVGKVGAGPH